MFRTKDLIFLSVVVVTIALGASFPDQVRVLAPYTAYGMMGMLFFSFLNIYPRDVWLALKKQPGDLAMLSAVKLIVMPALVYPVALWLCPDYAVGLLLLAGASTGVTAAFMVLLAGGNVPAVIVMATATNLLLPLTLPVMLKLLAGQVLEFNLLELGLRLAAIIFGPLLLIAVMRKLTPGVIKWCIRWSFPLSLVLLGFINVAVFGKYGPYLIDHPEHIVGAVFWACALAAFSAALGAAMTWRRSGPDRLTGAGSLSWSNSVLMVVIAADLGDPIAAVIAAAYLLPFYPLVVPLSALGRSGRQESEPGGTAETTGS